MGKYSEISAEMLLNFIDPESYRRWLAVCDGTFFRNYSDDTMSLDEDNRVAHIARDGFLFLLPKGYLSDRDELKGGNFKKKFEALTRRQKILKEAFIPFDSMSFRRRLRIQKEIIKLEAEKNDMILKLFYDFDVEKISDPHILRLRPIVPFLGQLRGKIGFIRSLLSSLFGCEVIVRKDVYSLVDTTRQFIPRVRFFLMMDGLDAVQYRRKSREIAPVCDFIRDKLIPFEMNCEIEIKSKSAQAKKILNYYIEI